MANRTNTATKRETITGYFVYGKGLKFLFITSIVLYIVIAIAQSILQGQMYSVVQQAKGLYETPEYTSLVAEYAKSVNALNLSDNFYYGFFLPFIVRFNLYIGYLSLILFVIAIIIFLFRKIANTKDKNKPS